MNDRFGAIADHFATPSNRGMLKTATLTGHAGSAGLWGTITIYLKVESGLIQDAAYEAEGCGYTSACGSILTEWVKGRTVRECMRLSPEEFAHGVDGVPVHKRHCPLLAVQALHDALKGCDA